MDKASDEEDFQDCNEEQKNEGKLKSDYLYMF
jgi:hypothetical protein